MILTSALMCLSLNIFHEARGEPILGQYAVAQVTVRRAEFDQAKVCAEVFRRKQFSWTSHPQKHPIQIDPDAWDIAQRIAVVVLRGSMRMDFSRGATHYHAVYVKPRWAPRMIRVNRIGSHIFYT